MKISARTIKRLGEIITGDKNLSPYRSGPDLVHFFNDFGMETVYSEGFPSRWSFAEDCLRHFNDTPTLRTIILQSLDPRDFMGATVFVPQSGDRKPADITEAREYLNDFLAYDGYKIVPHGNGHVIVEKAHGEIVVDVKLAPDHLSHAFIMEQIDKCRTKIAQGDYDGAITNARSLVEAVLAAIEKEVDSEPPHYDGDRPKLYKISPENWA